MTDFLRAINGPAFVLYYFFYSIIIFISLWFIRNKKLFIADDFPSARISPYMAALMKMPQNFKHFISTIITVLYAKKVIDISTDYSHPQIIRTQFSSSTKLELPEEIFMVHLTNSKPVSEIFSDSTLSNSLLQAREGIINQLEQENYIVSSKLKSELLLT